MWIAKHALQQFASVGSESINFPFWRMGVKARFFRGMHGCNGDTVVSWSVHSWLEHPGFEPWLGLIVLCSWLPPCPSAHARRLSEYLQTQCGWVTLWWLASNLGGGGVGFLVTSCFWNQGYLPLHGKTGNSNWKIKWFAPFHLGSLRKYGLWFEVMLFFCSLKSLQLM